MNDKPPSDSPDPENAPPSKGTFKYFQRRQKGERVPGRVLPPGPAWMQKPLKPPGVRFPTNGS